MPQVVLDILKYLFLALIFLFLMRAVRAMYFEVVGPRARTGAPSQPRSKAGRPPETVVVTQSDGRVQNLKLEDELIIGRSDKCQIVITDTYASQVHARVFRKGDQVMIEDMGSTNGTYLNRRKVTSPIAVKRGDTARIGKTQIGFKK